MGCVNHVKFIIYNNIAINIGNHKKTWSWLVSSLRGYNVGLGIRSRLLQKVWVSYLRVIGRHVMIILILQRGNGSPALVTRRPARETANLAVSHINKNFMLSHHRTFGYRSVRTFTLKRRDKFSTEILERFFWEVS